MDDLPQLKTTDLLRDSFTYAKERLPEIFKSQILYFILVLVAALAVTYVAVDMNELIAQQNAAQAVEIAIKKAGGKPDMSLINEIKRNQYPLFAKVTFVLLVLYFLGRLFINNLYVGLSKASAFPHYTLFPVANKVWRLIWIDSKVTIGVVIIVVTVVIAFSVFAVLAHDSSMWVGKTVINSVLTFIYCVMFCAMMVFTTAQPSVYTNVPIKLLKHFYPATQGFRWKILIAKTCVFMPVVIYNVGIHYVIKIINVTPDFFISFIINVPTFLLATSCLIWDVYVNVMLWEHIAPRLRMTFNTPTA